jgi:two-component system response regulator YesN
MEAINTAELEEWINFFFARQRREFEKTPRLALAFCEAVVELMISTFDNLQVPVSNKEAFRKQAQARFCACSSFEGLRTALLHVVREEIAQRLAEKQQHMALYAQQAMNYIDKHYADTVTLEVIAEKLHITPVHLSVVFKRETGMNYSKYLAAVRIEKSKALLKQPDMNLSQVANAVGYDSTSYFSNLFRKHTGLKPAEYRRLHQQDIGE